MEETAQPEIPNTNILDGQQWVLTIAMFDGYVMIMLVGFLHVNETWGSWISLAMTMMRCVHSTQPLSLSFSS